jgi:hypothetical protein
MARDGESCRGRREKGKRRKDQRTELTKWNSLTEDTPRDAVTNALCLHLHKFAYKTFKIKVIRAIAIVGGVWWVGVGVGGVLYVIPSILGPGPVFFLIWRDRCALYPPLPAPCWLCLLLPVS